MANFQPTPSFYNPQLQQHQIGYHQNVVEEEGLVTLLIRRLPEAIPPETLSRVFSGPGLSGRLKNCAFVDFKKDAVASQAQRQLHGYAYPPPDGNILTNIVNGLIAVSHFYTQVLHLMNKMDIPAPFRMVLPTPLPASVPAPPPPSVVEKP